MPLVSRRRAYHEGYDKGWNDANREFDRLKRFGKLCIRIGIHDKYALDHNIINEEELQFIHEMLDELVPEMVKGE